MLQIKYLNLARKDKKPFCKWQKKGKTLPFSGLLVVKSQRNTRTPTPSGVAVKSHCFLTSSSS